MKIRHGLITVTFYFILFYSSVFSLEHGTDLTREPAFYCLGYANCTGSECRYNRIAPISGWNPFNMSDKAALRCDSLDVEFAFPDGGDESFVGNETWTCLRYYDGVGHHFALLKITLNKPSDVIDLEVKCNASIGDCTLFHETTSQMVFVAGLPDSCVRWTADMESWLPTQNQTVDCPHYQNCDENTCHFNGTYTATANKHFFSGEWTLFKCGSLKVEIFVPVSNESNYIGNKTYSCFEYVNGEGVVFPAAEVNLTKSDDVKGSEIVCTFDGNKCRLQYETDSQVTLVAGFPSGCTPWVPPTPPPPPEAIADSPVTTMMPESTVTESDEPSITVSNTTAGADTTTWEPVLPTGVSNASASDTPSPVSNASTSVTPSPAPNSSTSVTSSPGGESTTPKAGTDVARLEFAAVLAMVVTLYIRQYL